MREVSRFEAIVYGEPIAQPRPTADGRGKFVRMIAAKSGSPVIPFKAEISLRVRRAMANLKLIPASGPVFLELDLVWQRNKKDVKNNPTRRLWKATRPDCDNVAKAVLDALTGVLFVDDNQIVGLAVRKYFGAIGESAHVRIGLTALIREDHSDETETETGRPNGGAQDDLASAE